MKIELILLIFALYLSQAEILYAADGGHGELLGAELELTSNQLSRIAEQVDFDELEKRFSNHEKSQAVPEWLSDVITKDLPLTHPHFLNLIPKDVKAVLLNGLTDSDSLAGMTLLRADGSSYEANSPQEKKIYLLNEPGKINTSANQKIELNSQPSLPKKHFEKKASQADQHLNSYFWQALNSRWSQIPHNVRLKLIPWGQLAPSSKSSLLMYLYTSKIVSKSYGPATEGFISDALDLKFHDESIKSLYNQFYAAPDSYGILEYHTLEPKSFNPFFQELKDFLKFLGIDRRVLKPGQNKLNNIGLHVHFSSPNLSRFDLKQFVLDYKRMMVFRALNQGDISVLVAPDQLHVGGKKVATHDYSFKASASNRDLINVYHAENNRIELRYFLEDVESEVRELKEVSEMDPARVKSYLFQETAKAITGPMITFIIKNRSDVFFELLPFQVWAETKLSDKDRFMLKEFFKSRSYLLIDSIQSSLRSGYSLSKSQVQLIESALAEQMQEPNKKAKAIADILKIKKMGVQFQNQLSHFSSDRNNLKTTLEYLEKEALLDLDSYSKRAEDALDEIRQEHRGSLEEMAPPGSTILSSLLEMSYTQTWARSLVLQLLKDENVLRKIRRVYLSEWLVKSILNHSESMDIAFQESLLRSLLGNSYKERVFDYLRRINNPGLSNLVKRRLMSNSCRYFY